MLEWHEIEVHQLGSWPNFPVCGYNIQIVSLQIFLYILEEDNGLKMRSTQEQRSQGGPKIVS